MNSSPWFVAKSGAARITDISLRQRECGACHGLQCVPQHQVDTEAETRRIVARCPPDRDLAFRSVYRTVKRSCGALRQPLHTAAVSLNSKRLRLWAFKEMLGSVLCAAQRRSTHWQCLGCRQKKVKPVTENPCRRIRSCALSQTRSSGRLPAACPPSGNQTCRQFFLPGPAILLLR